MTNTALSFISGQQITNASGVVQSGALLYFYREGTDTALTVWQDDGASSAHAQPVVCDAGGFAPLIYIDDTYDYKLVVKTSADVTLATYDNVPAPLSASASATFLPTLVTWTSVSSAPSMTAADLGKAYLADTTSADITFALPAAALCTGKGFDFKKSVAAHSLILDADGAETIDGATTLTLTAQYAHVRIVSDGTSWYISYYYNPGFSVNQPLVGVNATADSTNKLSVSSSAVLFNNVGNGTQVKLNKAAAADTASFLYQTNWSGRAEIGTCGDDNFSFKTSADGSTWVTGLSLVVAAKGVPKLPPFATGDLPAAATAGAGAIAYDTTLSKLVVSNGSAWVAQT